MVHRAIRITADDPSPLVTAFAHIRQEFQAPEGFSEPVIAEAVARATQPDEPDHDFTNIPFVTVDPPGATDLDQALCVEQVSGGYRVRYAIADVPAFVPPGGPIDDEARRRGQTWYMPDQRIPLHPEVLSEAAASLLPGQDRPAFVWDLSVDEAGELRAVDVVRGWVRSTEQYDYATVQKLADAGDDRFTALKDVGERRLMVQRQRGGASLAVPEQDIVGSGSEYHLEFRRPYPAEEWNAQISLLTGMAAADLMLAGHVGILRTLPAPESATVARFRRQAAALGVRWPAEQPYGDLISDLDHTNPKHLALMHEATSLFRGAGYTPFDGAPPEYAHHAAVADQYAHVTAPLRRLVDRFGLVICAALCRDSAPPGWVREALPLLPALMSASDGRMKKVERACTDVVETAVLSGRSGEVFDAIVVDVNQRGSGVVQVIDPAVVAPVLGEVQLGARLRVRLETADVSRRVVEFVPVNG
ncbi:MAG: RNB domain-containing ribonuclease [Actinomycetota bacterium]